MFAKVWSATLLGLKALQVAIEVDVAGGLPQTVLVGLPDTAVQESKERVRAAIKNSGFAVPQRKVIINLAPADVRKEGPSFDLPIALGILAASNQLETSLLETTLCLGELSLDGSLRPVTGVLPIVAAAKSMGIARVVVPAANGMEASMVDEIDVFAFESLQDVAEWFGDSASAPPLEAQTDDGNSLPTLAALDLADVKGQVLARRALEVAAAGGHNLLLVGSPGAGKTMLAKRLPGLLPPLTWSEVLEVTQVYSVAGLLRQGNHGADRAQIVRDRPFRSPHHSASGVSLVGGGSYPRPGEISLAHNGVLFLDELTEFRREVLEVLRQPLEDGRISISRARHSVEYPARTTLVASTNPCRCGYYGDPVVACTCTPTQRDRYWSKLSGPLLDRIDLHVRVNRLKPDEMMSMKLGESSEAVRARVLSARQRQQERFLQEPTLTCNAHMQSRHLREWCRLETDSRQLLEGAIRKLSLSARGTDRLLKVSRTIADLVAASTIGPTHIAEAIQYRSLDRAA
ncbi:MAG: YifB family Mg chelatase-like AAA ATPase [Cyanobacteria bacterium J06597_1]